MSFFVFVLILFTTFIIWMIRFISGFVIHIFITWFMMIGFLLFTTITFIITSVTLIIIWFTMWGFLNKIHQTNFWRKKKTFFFSLTRRSFSSPLLLSLSSSRSRFDGDVEPSFECFDPWSSPLSLSFDSDRDERRFERPLFFSVGDFDFDRRRLLLFLSRSRLESSESLRSRERLERSNMKIILSQYKKYTDSFVWMNDHDYFHD